MLCDEIARLTAEIELTEDYEGELADVTAPVLATPVIAAVALGAAALGGGAAAAEGSWF